MQQLDTNSSGQLDVYQFKRFLEHFNVDVKLVRLE
jgi:hypothetical protein